MIPLVLSALFLALAQVDAATMALVAPHGAFPASLMRVEDVLTGCPNTPGTGQICEEHCGRCLKKAGVTKHVFKQRVYDAGMSTSLFDETCPDDCAGLLASVWDCTHEAGTRTRVLLTSPRLTGCWQLSCKRCLSKKGWKHDAHFAANQRNAEVATVKELCPKDCPRYFKKIQKWFQQVEKRAF
mmetsp:Transcript_32568/g.95312  ORF Transcript_32568/g.95312 Transcript_32568/m.95312 type:complete len:184 (+) Transcript_32568:95-646(+)